MLTEEVSLLSALTPIPVPRKPVHWQPSYGRCRPTAGALPRSAPSYGHPRPDKRMSMRTERTDNGRRITDGGRMTDAGAKMQPGWKEPRRGAFSGAFCPDSVTIGFLARRRPPGAAVAPRRVPSRKIGCDLICTRPRDGRCPCPALLRRLSGVFSVRRSKIICPPEAAGEER